jgi:hypothetical protein
MTLRSLKVRLTITYFLKYNDWLSTILQYCAVNKMLTFHMFHTVAVAIKIVIIKNYNTVLFNILQTIVALETVWYFLST